MHVWDFCGISPLPVSDVCQITLLSHRQVFHTQPNTTRYLVTSLDDTIKKVENFCQKYPKRKYVFGKRNKNPTYNIPKKSKKYKNSVGPSKQ